jgi:hypothetical protein
MAIPKPLPPNHVQRRLWRPSSSHNLAAAAHMPVNASTTWLPAPVPLGRSCTTMLCAGGWGRPQLPPWCFWWPDR